ncbi:PAS/PAC sensor signal transduction histidine kinase [Arcobacter nitrofigilis DSM 7299]|uniref:histidine kinase n=1 Tax=Arcobacter nitrofigilis (strain ATCC 33309 / DSM 7299 / CCUG 15893 / LMG 7604 / NCTC 12251 / CI) TaxID=572480 RepID=D5V6Y5_ARCNC|nr:ABC transporter substrate binding protein [Arcobacter nitrofigilis]ADG94405.1 PAS/PAC sensor signal transduction histidine kinase [Arcobacter nitrofigilis DSM 7299]
MKYLFFLLLIFNSLFANAHKEILLLHSYNDGLKWSDGITNGLKSVISRYPDYELSIEYMDTKRNHNKDYFDILSLLYTKKYADKKFDLIITADNYAFNFALSNNKEIFHNTPIIFCGLENFNKIKIPNNMKNSITGVIEYKEIKKNIQLINNSIKDLNTLYIISDNTLSSKAIRKQILDAIAEYKDKIHIIFDTKIDIKTINQKIKKLPPNSAILFTSLYKDINDKFLYPKDLKDFFENSIYPVFAITKIHLGEGIVGGIMVDPYEQGKLAGNMANNFLNGTPIKDIDMLVPISKQYSDYAILKKFDLLDSNIQNPSTTINKPKDFFEENRKMIDSTFILLPLLFLLIIGLIVNIVKKVNLEIRLLEQAKLDNVLLNNIKSIIYWKSKEGIILGCNDSLCKLLDLSKDKIVGKDLNDIFPEICQKIDDTKAFISDLETTLRNRDNEIINVLIRRKKYLNKKNKEAGIVTIINDITDLKKLENQGKKDEQFMIQRSKLYEVGEMITSVAHQWKAPLIEISTIAQELLYKKDISKNSSKEFVDEIMTQVKYMTNTIDDFRDFIRPSIKKSEFEINSAINQLLRVIEHNTKYNYINVEINYEENKIYTIYGYANEFKQAILNIINNSKDSILKRRQIEEFQAKISISISLEDDLLCISIKDNGIGIKDDNLEKIFEPFFTSKKNGDGFGLYMVKLIIEDKMNGIIKALPCKEGANIFICMKNRTEE